MLETRASNPEFQRKPQKRGLKESAYTTPCHQHTHRVSKKTSKKRIERGMVTWNSSLALFPVSKKTSKKRIESTISFATCSRLLPGVSKKTSKKRIERTHCFVVEAWARDGFQRKPQKRGLKVLQKLGNRRRGAMRFKENLKKEDWKCLFFVSPSFQYVLVSKKTSKKRIESSSTVLLSIIIFTSFQRKPQKRGLKVYDFS